MCGSLERTGRVAAAASLDRRPCPECDLMSVRALKEPMRKVRHGRCRSIIRRALISVSDKAGLIDFARGARATAGSS